MPSWPTVFQSESRCIFPLRPSFRPCNSLSILFIHLTFLLCSLRCHIFAPKLFSFPYVWLLVYLRTFSPYLPVEFSFVVFGISCFVRIVWSYLGIFLVFLLSTLPFDLFPRVVSFDLIVLLCSFCPNISSRIIIINILIFSFTFDFLQFFMRFLPKTDGEWR